MLTFVIMSCAFVNNMLFCAKDVRKELTVRTEAVESFEDYEYRVIPDLRLETKAHAVTDKFVHETSNGCRIFIKDRDTVYYESPCSKLRKVLKIK